jgi:hypothetical protein
VVRARGRVEATVVRRSRLGNHPAVACSFCLRGEFGGVIDADVEADDFLLRLADGELVRVRAAGAAREHALAIVDGDAAAAGAKELPRATGGWFQEARVAPGEEIEVVGLLRRELDSSAAAPGPRALPTIWSLVAPLRKKLALYCTGSQPGGWASVSSTTRLTI